jgi:hypothetical protein
MDTGQAIWLVGWAYVLVNAGRVASYGPQILVLWRCRDGAQSISLVTWSYWTVSHLTAVLYAGLVIADGKLLAVSIGNLASCATVIALIVVRRRGASRSAQRPTPMACPSGR